MSYLINSRGFEDWPRESIVWLEYRPFSFHFREKNIMYNERMVNNVITLSIIIGIILLLAIIIIPIVLICGGTPIFIFGDFIIAIICIVLIVKLIKRIKNGKKQK